MSADRPVVGVGVVVVDRGRLLLIQRGGDLRHGQWAVPGGKVEYGETLIECAEREVREETGLEIDVGSVVWVGDAIGEGDPPDHHISLIDFSGRLVGGELGAGDDALDARLVPLDEVRDLDLTPTMYDLLDRLGL